MSRHGFGNQILRGPKVQGLGVGAIEISDNNLMGPNQSLGLMEHNQSNIGPLVRGLVNKTLETSGERSADIIASIGTIAVNEKIGTPVAPIDIDDDQRSI